MSMAHRRGAFSGKSTSPSDLAPALAVHVIHALRMGGLENGLVNLINYTDPTRFRHAIVCMTDFSEFRERIRHPNVEVVALHKDRERLSRLQIVARLYRLFRAWRPAVVHGRNWDGLDAMLPAWLARVPVRIHGEHGRDMHDLDGTSRRQQWLRRLNRPFTTHYTAVSRDLASYLTERVGVPSARVTRICNGVDVGRFSARGEAREPLPDGTVVAAQALVIGTVARLTPVKDQASLIRAVAMLERRCSGAVHLVLVGDGPQRPILEACAHAEGIAGRVTFAGARDDVPAWLRAFDVFALPSLAEGISNTVLEAMASALPVVATDVGGNADLVAHGVSGLIVPVRDVSALTAALGRYLDDRTQCREHGLAGRERAERDFSIRAMVDGYIGLYEDLRAGASGGTLRMERPSRA